MPKRRIYLIVIAVGVFVGLGVAFIPSREPSYEGKRLSEWVEELDRTDSVTREREAVEAIRHIGTNALPYLVKWIRYDRPPWKRKLYRVINSSLENVNPTWQIEDNKRDRAGCAMVAFAALGPTAEPAIPQLVLL